MKSTPLSLRVLAAALLLALLAGAPARADDAKAAAPAAPHAAPAAERVPMLWEVDTQPKIYLFGTIHVGDPRVLAHPAVVQKALDRSQAVFIEIAMEADMMMKILPRVRLSEGQSLKEILPPATRERLRKLFGEKGLVGPMLDALDVIQPWALYLQLQTFDVEPGQQGKALDQTLYDGGKEQGKEVGGLEEIDEQIDIFAALSMPEQVRLLEGAMDALEKARGQATSPLEELVGLYLKGDAEALMRSMTAEMDRGDELSVKLMKRMIDDRNVNMVQRLLKRAQEHPDQTLFVAVGTGHYPGPKGILALLRKTGFRVRQLKTLADMDKPWPLEVGGASPSSRAKPAGRRRTIRVGPFCIPSPCCR